MQEKHILLLRICKKEFEELVTGKLHARYLEVKPYWETRLFESDWSPKKFDEVHIKNGYKSDSPLAIFEYKWTHWPQIHNGKNCFQIPLGDLISVENYTK